MATKDLNRVTLIGRLGKDPELNYTSSGIAKCGFSVATSESWQNDAKEKQEKTEWHNIIAWKKLAEICGQYLKKGSKVYIEGKLTTESWEDKNTKEKKYATKIVLVDMIMLDGKSGSGDEAISVKAEEVRTETPSASDESTLLPF